MNLDLLNAIYGLKEALDDSEEFIEFKKLDEEISSNLELQKLAFEKDQIIMRLEDNYKIYKSLNDEHVLCHQIELGKIITKMNSYDIVKRYNFIYRNVQLTIKEINKRIKEEIIIGNSYVKSNCREI